MNNRRKVLVTAIGGITAEQLTSIAAARDILEIMPPDPLVLMHPIADAADYPTTDRKQRHHDVTGFFQRTGRKGKR